jgi:hypothetical protein
LLGWTLFVLFIVASFAEPYRTTLKDYHYDEFYSALYASLSPLLFCTAFAWIIFIGENGPKSIGKWHKMITDLDEISIPDILTKLLEWRGFAVMSIFSYSFYLTHFLVAFYLVGKNKTPLYMETWADIPIEVVGGS